jgi:sterol desaturase/sphingolipid hydroxylase (fatty acid hydroxylase superfamily)
LTRAFISSLSDEGLWLPVLALRAWVTALLPWAQVALAVLVADFLSYWVHRAYHRFPVLWAFHIVHHTSEELDWLSTSRLHPLSQALNTALIGTALLLGGFPVAAVVAANVLIGGAALVAHANVRWSFGPLQYLFVSPLFHQWHHACIDEKAHEDREHVDSALPERGGNFGAIFSIWDQLFGTWRLPALNRPARFGVGNAPAPTVWGLLLHPMRAGIRVIGTLRPSQSGLSDRGGTQGPVSKIETSTAKVRV